MNRKGKGCRSLSQRQDEADRKVSHPAFFAPVTKETPGGKPDFCNFTMQSSRLKEETGNMK
jgi:hypothetical protein